MEADFQRLLVDGEKFLADGAALVEAVKGKKFLSLASLVPAVLDGVTRLVDDVNRVVQDVKAAKKLTV